MECVLIAQEWALGADWLYGAVPFVVIVSLVWILNRRRAPYIIQQTGSKKKVKVR